MIEYVDIFFVSIAALSTIMGACRGVIWEVLKYGVVIISCLIAGFASFKCVSLFETSDYAFLWLAIVSAIVFFLVSTIMMHFLHKLHNLIQSTTLRLPDRVLGAVFGLIRAILFSCVLYSGLMIVTINQKPDWLAGSMFIPYLDKANIAIQKFIHAKSGKKLQELIKMDQLLDKFNQIKPTTSD